MDLAGQPFHDHTPLVPRVCWPELPYFEDAFHNCTVQLNGAGAMQCHPRQPSVYAGGLANCKFGCLNSLLCAGPTPQELLCETSCSNLELLSNLQQWKQQADSDDSGNFKNRLLVTEAAREALAGRIIQVSVLVACSNCHQD
jgi:hypothetical protein